MLIAYERDGNIKFTYSIRFRHITNNYNQVVCFLLGNSPASEFYMPTFRNTLFHLLRQVVVKNGHSSHLAAYEDGTECSETSAIKFRRRGITQKKAYNIQNTAKVWNQELQLHIVWFLIVVHLQWRLNQQVLTLWLVFPELSVMQNVS